MIQILSTKEIEESKFQLVFSFNGVQHQKTIVVHEEELFDDVKGRYITLGEDVEFSMFLRNNQEFRKKIFELVRCPLDNVAFPISVPLEWEEKVEQLKVA